MGQDKKTDESVIDCSSLHMLFNGSKVMSTQELNDMAMTSESNINSAAQENICKFAE